MPDFLKNVDWGQMVINLITITVAIRAAAWIGKNMGK